MTRELRFSKRATRQIAAASAWWRENRPIAPTMFEDELRRCLAALAQHPEANALVDETDLRGTRRALMAKARYHLYYRIAGDGGVNVIACWHTSRGTRPPTR